MTKTQTLPLWFAELNMSGHLRRQIVRDFTIHVRGYMCWYKGAPRWVCGKGTKPEDVHDAWADKRKEIDKGYREVIVRKRNGYSIREAAGLFYEHLDHRVKTGQPKPLSPYSRRDYFRYVNAFGKAVGAERQLEDLGPDDFTAFAKRYGGASPSELARCVSNIGGFFTWCQREGFIQNVPAYGSYFAKPPKQAHRDKRIEQKKCYAIRELRALWAAAGEKEKLWMGLGLNGALDNADLASLTNEVVDLNAGVLDYRRRKIGKARRVIPLRPEVLDLLESYQRPAPREKEDGRLYLLTETGRPLGRIKDGAATDAVARRWQKLMVKAGLRKKPKLILNKGRGNNRRRKLKFPGDSDRRGFRSLRTTFSNLVPVGYSDERRIIMGHAGDTFVENYLERFGMQRLEELVNHVWDTAFTLPLPVDESSSPGAAAASRASRRAASTTPRA